MLLLVWGVALTLGGLGSPTLSVLPFLLYPRGVVFVESGSTFGLAERLAAWLRRADLRCIVMIVGTTRAARLRRCRAGAFGIALLLSARSVGLAPRTERERADLARACTDSVLHTLTLIQRIRATPGAWPPQERELRTWLYPDRAATAQGTLADRSNRRQRESRSARRARRRRAAPGTAPLVRAHAGSRARGREVYANAARHSGVDRGFLFPRWPALTLSL